MRKTRKANPQILNEERIRKEILLNSNLSEFSTVCKLKGYTVFRKADIRRVIYDEVCGGKWVDFVAPNFVDNCSNEQLDKCIEILELFNKDDIYYKQCIERTQYNHKKDEKKYKRITINDKLIEYAKDKYGLF